MEENTEALKKELEFYKSKCGAAAYDPAIEGYMILVDQLKQRNKYLSGFKISENINQKKEDLVYARGMDLIDGLPKMISSVNSLKMELNLEFIEEDGTAKIKPISPQSMGA